MINCREQEGVQVTVWKQLTSSVDNGQQAVSAPHLSKLQHERSTARKSFAVSVRMLTSAKTEKSHSNCISKNENETKNNTFLKIAGFFWLHTKLDSGLRQCRQDPASASCPTVLLQLGATFKPHVVPRWLPAAPGY